MARFRIGGGSRKGPGGKGKGGNGKKPTNFKVKKPVEKPNPVMKLNKTIRLDKKKLLGIEQQLAIEKEPGKIVDLSIKLCWQKVILASSKKRLFNWWLENPEALAVLESSNTQKYLHKKIVEMDKIIAEEEQKADNWRTRKEISLRK